MRRIFIFEGFMIYFWDGWYTVHLFLELYDFRISNCGIDYLKTEFHSLFTWCQRWIVYLAVGKGHNLPVGLLGKEIIYLH